MSVLPEFDPGEWEAVVTPGGRWVWHIAPHKGLMGLREGYLCFGTEARAERKARRILARLRRDDERMADQRVVA